MTDKNIVPMKTILQVIEDLENNLNNSYEGIKFVPTTEPKNGIITTNYAFTKAKELRQSPLEIAKGVGIEIEKYISSCNCYCNNLKVLVAGPYVNIQLMGVLTFDGVNAITVLNKIDKKVMMEYVSPNVAKPIHIGHTRNMNIGESIRRILSLSYNEIITDNHWGDWGVQFGTLLHAYKYFRDNIYTSSITLNEEIVSVSFDQYDVNPFQTLLYLYIWSSQNKDKFDDYDGKVRAEFLALESRSGENIDLWQQFVDISKGEIKEDLARFNVRPFDIEQGESFYEPKIKEVYNFFETNNLWIKDGQARYIDFSKYSKPTLGYAYLISSNGYSTYLIRDVVARISWINDFDTSVMVTVTGNEQVHHFEQFFEICDLISKLGITKSICKNPSYLAHTSLKHISYGSLSLKDQAKMSTRNGVVYTAKDFYYKIYNAVEKSLIARYGSVDDLDKVDKIAIAAIKWFDLQRDTVGNLVMDIDEILSFEGNTGVYQLYTIARINSLLTKNLYSNNSKYISVDTGLLTPQELIIVNRLYSVTISLQSANSLLKPHILANYNYALANDINSWYNTCSLIEESNDTRKQTLLCVMSMCKDLLIFNLDLLAITAIDKM